MPELTIRKGMKNDIDGIALLENSCFGSPLSADMILKDMTENSRFILSAQVGVAMMAGLLISPISWSHHWVWCLPILMTLATAAWRWYSPALAVTALAGAAVFALAMQWWFPGQNHAERS